MLRRLSTLQLLAVGLILGFVLAWIVRQGIGQQVSLIGSLFTGLFIEGIPFLVIGAIASGLIAEFMGEDALRKWLPQGRLLGIMTGALLGLLIPISETGTMPLTRRLMKKGVPVHVAITFALASPVINPLSIYTMTAAFGFGPTAMMRLGLTLLIAVSIGLIFSVERHPGRLIKDSGLTPVMVHLSDDRKFRAKLNDAFILAGHETLEFGGYFIAGSMLAAIVQATLPQSWLLGQGLIASVAAFMLLGLVLSVSATLEPYAALAYANQGSSAAMLGFLVIGPMIDLRATWMYQAVFRRRTIVYICALAFMMTLLATGTIELFGPGL
jgi:hypothetical protein